MSILVTVVLALLILAIVYVGLVAGGGYHGLLPWERRWILRLPHKPCCTSCKGTGRDASAPETNGMCWDCQGTGHAHA